MSEIHRSHLAGTWYPADTEELRETVCRYLAEAGAEADEGVLALVVPHAGYRYSGRCAGAAYARLPRGRWRRTAILAPSHYHFFAGGAVFSGSGFETPLGIVEVDRVAARALGEQAGFFLDDAPYAREHSLEIQLPFLQAVDPGLRLIPILVGVDTRSRGFAALAPGLRTLDDGGTLFVVSSDFTHYGASFEYQPFPSLGPRQVADELWRLDEPAIELVRHVDATGFEEYVERTGITICGRAPIAAFLHAASGLAGELVAYSTSLDVTGDYEHSVSYAAVVFRRS